MFPEVAAIIAPDMQAWRFDESTRPLQLTLRPEGEVDDGKGGADDEDDGKGGADDEDDEDDDEESDEEEDEDDDDDDDGAEVPLPDLSAVGGALMGAEGHPGLGGAV
jgi:hypothetical protein